ncbi:MAG TPA: FAD-dependent oxidoreductase [Pirellulales bacterium]|nr:FAD-dependent oxidoreductase [Pirellulales bacterium]
MRVAVIGAGPAGITAAMRLAQGGADVVVYEAGDRVGGLARSLDLWGQRVDLGPHRFFSTDARVNRLWLDVVGRDYRMVDRLTRIHYRGRFFRYPLRPVNALANMGVLDASRVLASYLRERVAPSCDPKQDRSFESWIVSRFGRQLYDMFFKSYSEKLWGIPCSELDADFAAQRIKKFSLAAAVKQALMPGKQSAHATLVDRFAYPLGGTGSVYERMADRVRALGGEIHLKSPVRRVLRDGLQVRGLELVEGQIETCDHVISTMPLTLLVRGLGDIPRDVQASVDRLRFRNTVLVYLHVDSSDLFPDQWVYIHSEKLRMGRLTNFRNWVPELYGNAPTTVLAAEYWCFDSDALWTEPDDTIIAKASAELQSTGLSGDAKILAGHVVRLPRCYPVYARGYREHVERVVAYLQTLHGITPIGRYGAFKYNSQDHSILMGILAAENVLEHRNHDLWAVNTDYATYQEDALITESGLVAATNSGIPL